MLRYSLSHFFIVGFGRRHVKRSAAHFYRAALGVLAFS
jgi:hypothetical protein